MPRVLIWTAQRPLGELAAEELRNEGIPAVAALGSAGEMYPTQLEEVWLEDEALLNDVDVKRAIERVIGGLPLDETDEEKIAAMPLRDEPEKPQSDVRLKRAFRLPSWVVPILVIGIIVAALWLGLEMALR